MLPLFENEANRRAPNTHADTPAARKLVARVVRCAAGVIRYPRPRDGHATRELVPDVQLALPQSPFSPGPRKGRGSEVRRCKDVATSGQ